MDFAFTDEQRMIREAVRDFAQGELAPKAADVDRTGRFPIESVRQLAGMGLFAMCVPEEFGGGAAGAVAQALAQMEVAEADASLCVVMSVTNMVAEAINRDGTDEQKRRFIPMLVSGEFPVGAFVLTEAQAGSDATNIRTRAERDGDAYVLNGQKVFITSAAWASVYLVFARTGGEGSDGISAFLIERGTPGMTVGKEEKKMGLNGSNTCELVFENCRVPVQNRVLDEGRGFRVAMGSLDGGRIGVASQAIGIGRAAMRAALAYAPTREAFGKPLTEIGAIQHKIADMATELDAAQLLALRAAWLKEQGRGRFTREASMAKVFASEAANRVCKEAVQVFGGYGYCTDYPVERHYRDCKVTTLYEGTSEIQRLVIARSLLRD
ncbi:acyl-CoA dehydrogenase family protein [bacterium]|nr:acyl-CoA dehydrogenase family protein [bacterium]